VKPLLSEQEHQKYLDLFLQGVRNLRQRGLEEQIKNILPYITDNLCIARDVGYEKLAREYASLFREEGLVLEL
jgi:hypothetical protein